MELVAIKGGKCIRTGGDVTLAARLVKKWVIYESRNASGGRPSENGENPLLLGEVLDSLITTSIKEFAQVVSSLVPRER